MYKLGREICERIRAQLFIFLVPQETDKDMTSFKMKRRGWLCYILIARSCLRMSTRLNLEVHDFNVFQTVYRLVSRLW